jgi:hypothetical protein
VSLFSESEILVHVRDYMHQAGGQARRWRVGLTPDDAEDALALHGVDLDTDVWIWRKAVTPRAARNAVQALLARGCTPADRDAPPEEADTVYAYRDKG